jgi:uncharacterized protein
MLNASEVSVGLFSRGLTNLKRLLTKAEDHALSIGAEPGSLLTARLADDMYDLALQVHWAAEGAKLAVQRLLGGVATTLPPEAKSFGELQLRLDATIAQLGECDAEALELGLARTLELPQRGGVKVFGGAQFLTEFAIPNFYFHLTAAYAILRNQGVPLQKSDFMGA